MIWTSRPPGLPSYQNTCICNAIWTYAKRAYLWINISGFKFVVETISYISVWCFVDCYLSFCPFSFGHCTVCPSIYGFCLPLLVSYSIFFYNRQFCFLEVSLALGSLCSLQQRATHIESLQRTRQDLKCQIDQKDDKIKDFKREAEDLRTR
jgi:hypothetical protein